MKHGCALLADRNAPMLQGVRGLLDQLFEVVVMVADENSLVMSVERLQPELAVVDMSFPVAKGNVLEVVRSRCPGLKVIALSTHDEPVAVERILSLGASACVLKRAAATDLIPAVTDVLAGRVYVSPAVQRAAPGRPESESR